MKLITVEDLYIICQADIIKHLKQAHNWSYKTGKFVETIVLTSQPPLQAYWLQSISPRAPHPTSLVI